MVTKLSAAQVEKRLAGLKGWTVKDGKLHREFKFGSFVKAFGWMTSVALCAEAANHHPEWFNVYDKVRVDLSTHDAGGITDKDFDLAENMDRLAG
jgi:4a-hydroxytetrahydrobiopterin dehydratase